MATRFLYDLLSDSQLIFGVEQWTSPLPESQMVYAVDDVDQLCSSSQDVTLREYATAYDAVQNGDFESTYFT